MGRLVSVVLITWNSAPWLRRCLAGIAGQEHRNLELIQVDNASADDSVARVRAAFPEAKQIVNSANLGFAAAANQGIRRSRGDCVALCNPDAFLTPGYLSKILAALDTKGSEFGAATGTLFRGRGYEIEPTEEIDSLGIRMTRSGRHFDITDGLKPVPHEVFGVSGAAAVYRRS